LDTEKFIVGRIFPDHFGGDASTDIVWPDRLRGSELFAKDDRAFCVFTKGRRLGWKRDIIERDARVNISIDNSMARICKVYRKFNRLSSDRRIGFEGDRVKLKLGVCGGT
jgi:hypothetical protein